MREGGTSRFGGWIVPDNKLEIQLKAAEKRLGGLERAVDELKKGFRMDSSVAVFEIEQKAFDKRLSGMERAMEELKKAFRTDAGVAKFEPPVVAMEKQVAVLVASTLTKKDLQVLEQATDSKDAANLAQANRAELEGRELARKDMKRLEAMVAKLDQENHQKQIERQLEILQTEIKRVETTMLALSKRT